MAKPNAGILYATLAKEPKLPFDYQVSSTRHFMRELNRLGVTGAIDAGGGYQNYPEDYEVVRKLNEDGQLTVRLAYNLFTQKPKSEKADFLTGRNRRNINKATTTFVIMALAKCWCSLRLTSRIFASRDQTCQVRWKASLRK